LRVFETKNENQKVCRLGDAIAIQTQVSVLPTSSGPSWPCCAPSSGAATGPSSDATRGPCSGATTGPKSTGAVHFLKSSRAAAPAAAMSTAPAMVRRSLLGLRLLRLLLRLRLRLRERLQLLPVVADPKLSPFPWMMKTEPVLPLPARPGMLCMRLGNALSVDTAAAVG
jgi:hypothetical protein